MREALSGVLCRCTGYVKPVQAVLRAAAVLRGEKVPPIDEPIDISDALDFSKGGEGQGEPLGTGSGDTDGDQGLPETQGG